MTTLQNNEGRFQAAYWGMIGVLASYILMIIFGFTGTLSGLLEASTPMAMIIVGSGFMGVGITVLVGGILFWMWFYRAYQNMKPLGIDTSYKTSWSIWGWIVPIVSLWYPYKIMKEIHNGYAWYIRKHNSSYEVNNLANMIGWWWATYLIHSFGDNVSSRLDDAASISGPMLFGAVVSLISLLLILKIMKRTHEFEIEAARIYESGQTDFFMEETVPAGEQQPPVQQDQL